MIHWNQSEERGPPTGSDDESMSPAHLATEDEMAAPDDSGFGVLVFEQNSLYLKLQSEIRTTETGRVVLVCAFFKATGSVNSQH